MIQLPPGCSVTYAVWIDVNELTDEIVSWYQTIGGEQKTQEYYDYRGKRINQHYVKYGNSKWCHHHHNGQGGTRLHFLGKDASIASMFILKFLDNIVSHNLEEVMERQEHDLN